MTYSYRNNGNIKDFWPDDDDKTIYIPSDIPWSMQELIEKANQKWPHIKMSDIEISSEKIHTHCLTYDRYDPGDYTNFIILSLSKS